MLAGTVRLVLLEHGAIHVGLGIRAHADADAVVICLVLVLAVHVIPAALQTERKKTVKASNFASYSRQGGAHQTCPRYLSRWLWEPFFVSAAAQSALIAASFESPRFSATTDKSSSRYLQTAIAAKEGEQEGGREKTNEERTRD